MNHYITPNNQIFGFDDDQSALVPKDAILIPTDYTFDQYPYLSVSKKKLSFDVSSYNADLNKKIIVGYETAAQAKLDLVAQSWGYDSLITAASYANSTNAQFKAEAEALIAWRDSYWTEAYTVEAGTLPATAEAFVALLPVAPIKPVI